MTAPPIDKSVWPKVSGNWKIGWMDTKIKSFAHLVQKILSKLDPPSILDNNFSETINQPQLSSQVSKWLDFGVYSTYFSISWNFWWTTLTARWRCHQVDKNLSFESHFMLQLSLYGWTMAGKDIKRLLRPIPLIWGTSRPIRSCSKGVNSYLFTKVNKWPSSKSKHGNPKYFYGKIIYI